MMSQQSSTSRTSSNSIYGATFSQRIVVAENYTAFPIPQLDVLYSQFKGAEVRRVPVIRIYGATPKGQKTCTHVHGVFPYLYILDDPGIENLDQRLSLALDRGISGALQAKGDGGQHVHKVVRVSGRSFYGYKPSDETFLKIYFYSPFALNKANDLLQAGTILGQRFQPYEAHIPYILQFFMDFKLYGMNFIHFSRVRFRGRAGSSSSGENCDVSESHDGIWDLAKLSPQSFLPPNVLKASRCELEIDVDASEIIVSQSRSGKNPGIEAIWMDERERRRQNGMLDWAQVGIPDSQERPTQSFIFKREEELMGVLRGLLPPPDTDYPSMSPSHMSFISPVESPYSSQEPSTPSSQVLIENVGLVNSGQLAGSESDRADAEMVALLEEMAGERDAEQVEPDFNSILGSQFLADMEDDPYLISLPQEPVIMEEEENDEKDNEHEWTQDFLSNSMLVAAAEEAEQLVGTSHRGGGGGFMMDQSDGAFDDSSSESDDEVMILYEGKSPPSSAMLSPFLSDTMPPSASPTVSPLKPRVKVPEGSPEIVDLTSSDDEEDELDQDTPEAGGLAERLVLQNLPGISPGSSIVVEGPKDSGITSFYEYPGEPSLILSSDSDDGGETQMPDSQQSIQSVYEYPSCGDSDDEYADTSFQDISLDYSQPNDTDESPCSSQDDSSVTSGEDGDEVGDVSLFRILEEAGKQRRKRRAQLQAKDRTYGRPSLQKNEVKPIKQPATVFSVASGACKSVPVPACQKYWKEKLKAPDKGRYSLERRTWMQEMMCMKARLKGTSPPRLQLKVPTKVGSKKRAEDLSESEEDEMPGPAKRFGFGRLGSGSEAGDRDSDVSEEDEHDTIVPSPMSVPESPASSQGSLTPKSVLRDRTKGTRKRRRLTWESDSPVNSQESEGKRRAFPKVRLNESELDSLSFTTESQCRARAVDLDASNFQNAKALHECQFLSTLSVEVHCCSRNGLTPDPQYDSVQAIFYSLHRDNPERSYDSTLGCFMIEPESAASSSDLFRTECVNDEVSLFKRFIEFVQKTDPDVLVGYEITKFSWGYLVERGVKIGLEMTSELSRLLPQPNYAGRQYGNRNDTGWNEAVNGRIVLNLWRLLRHEITVTSYTFENAIFQILHERVHLLPYNVLHNYWTDRGSRLKVMSYFKTRVENVIRIIEKLDLINRTSELARLFGIQFFEVLSRGSQFRVESMMLRLAKPADLVPPSPSPMQRGSMKAPEYLPLIMEPESKFYMDPVAVLDFQSLYPSMMMAYNYCFSTCIGRVQHLGEDSTFQFGCLNQYVPPAHLKSLLDNDMVTISPCGVVFVKASVKKGILGEMLEQILETRQMVKRSMKKWKDDETLQKVLDSRQLGLKLIANVTYGYTSANFSGRMACVEIADSVVSKGRETLQRAIDYVKSEEDCYGAKVVYGDTDSLFLHFPGKTREEAFRLSQRIVDAVTAHNPKPVKLKLEKVYQPCILQTKKRYVGFAYETPDQEEPKYDAKGIETVRRDGCPAVAKILEGALKTLFVTQNELMVKKFVQEQFRKIFMGRVSLSLYTFAREFRGRAGYKPTAVVPALELSKILAEKDPRAEPLPSQRVPYIVVYGSPGLPLIKLVRRPQDFIGNQNLRLNAHYYIEKAIMPALNRSLALASMDVGRWYAEMPRRYLKSYYTEGGAKKGTIDQYFKSESCVKCECRTELGWCDNCFQTVEALNDYLCDSGNLIISKYDGCSQTCRSCSGEAEMICINMDCPVKHRFLRYERDFLTKLPAVRKISDRIHNFTP